MANDYRREIARLLETHGVTSFHFEYGSKHPRVVITHGAITRFYVIPASGSDSHRGILKCLADIRRLFGLREPRRGARERRRRNHRATPRRSAQVFRPEPPADTREDRFRAPLEQLKQAMAAAAVPAEAIAAKAVSRPATAPRKVALRTPWLGARRRVVTV